MSRNRRKQIENDDFFAASQDFEPLPIADLDSITFDGKELPVLRSKDGMVQFGNFTIGTTGLHIEHDITESEWWAFIDAVQRIETSLQWIIGDWIVYGEEKLNKTYEQIAERIERYSAKSIREYAYVARNIPVSIRMDTLSFGHHQLVAKLKTEKQKTSWLLKAVKQQWSVARMRQELGLAQLPSAQSPLASQANRKVIDRVWRNLKGGKPISRDDVMHLRRWLDEVESSLDD